MGFGELPAFVAQAIVFHDTDREGDFETPTKQSLLMLPGVERCAYNPQRLSEAAVCGRLGVTDWPTNSLLLVVADASAASFVWSLRVFDPAAALPGFT